MRLLGEIVIIGALIYVGWEIPFRDRTPWAKAAPAPHVRAAPNHSGAWMWDPNRKTALDRPAYNQTRSFVGHITYVDEKGEPYWLDASGHRHYEP